MVIEEILLNSQMLFQASITDVLNQWNEMGVFSYVLPFLLIFAIVYGILEKAKFFSNGNEPNRGVNAIIALAIGFISLQFDFVSTFFATIFPRFGVGIAIFLVFIIFAGLFYDEGKNKGTFLVIGVVIAVAVIIWAMSNWSSWGYYGGISYWLEDNFWAIIIGIIVIVAITLVVRKNK